MIAGRTRYRILAFLTDITGIKSSVEIGKPKQPRLNKKMHGRADTSAIDEQWFRDVIGRKIATHPGNRMEYPFAGEPIFDEPLVGFVRGDDPLLAEYKKIIGPFHLTPTEIMAWQAEKNRVAAPRPEEISVVSFIMPITDATKKENARQSDWLSERWAQTRRQGEMFSRSFVREIVADLMARGVLAVSPDTAPFFTKKRYPGAGWASPWSHRHMAYAAGLGTFGAHDFLITEKGAAHRCGSFVVNLRLRPDRQRPDDIHAWCAHYRTGGCLACVSRCPTGAISEQGHDKEKCYNRVIRSIPRCVGEYHIMIYGCGLCSVGVPCESGIPEKVLKKK